MEARRAWRELIITTPGLGEFISGAILYDETIRQSKNDGTSFIKLLAEQGLFRVVSLVLSLVGWYFTGSSLVTFMGFVMGFVVLFASLWVGL